MEHTIQNHLGSHQDPRENGKKYKNRYCVIIPNTDINGEVVEVGDYWLNEVDYNLLKPCIGSCYVWHIPGTCSPWKKTAGRYVGASAVDGYEMHVLTDKKLEAPWCDVRKPCPTCGRRS